MNRRAAQRRWRRWLRRVGWRAPEDGWPSRLLEARMLAEGELLGALRRRHAARHGPDEAARRVWDQAWRRATRGGRGVGR